MSLIGEIVAAAGSRLPGAGRSTDPARATDPDGGTGRLIMLGTLAGIAVVVGATGTGHRASAVLPGGPFGMWHAAPPAWRGGFALLSVIGIAGLIIAFARLYALARSGAVGVSSAVRAAMAWAAPMLVAPPMLSLDAYAYAAQGRMVVRGLDPYVMGPEQLNRFSSDLGLLSAVDPVWRDTPVPYGPAALALLRVLSAVTGGDPVGFVLVLRVVAVAAVVLTVLLAARLAVPGQRAEVIVLAGANPIVVLHLVGGAHLDALLAALAAVVLVAARSRWWWLAGLAAVLAFSIKLPGLVLVGYVLLARVRGPHGWLAKTRAVLAALPLLVVATLLGGLTVPDGWGWVGALGTPGTVRTWWSPATLFGWLVHQALSLAGFGSTFDTGLQLSRLLFGGIGAFGVLVLLWWGAGEPSWRRAGKYAGLALVVLAVTAPVMYAWYLVWGMVLVVTCGTTGQKAVAVMISAAMVWSAIPPVMDWAGWIGVLSTTIGGVVSIAVATDAVAPATWRTWRARRRQRRAGRDRLTADDQVRSGVTP